VFLIDCVSIVIICDVDNEYEVLIWVGVFFNIYRGSFSFSVLCGLCKVKPLYSKIKGYGVGSRGGCVKVSNWGGWGGGLLGEGG
jgi:hypothetical protein